MNHWLKILEAFKAGKFTNYWYGLTPRFIIGACQTPIGAKFATSDLAYEATKQMYDEMQTFNNNGLVVVSNQCDIHKGPVMSLAEYKWSLNTIATSFEEVWNRYGKEIVDGNYHINPEERKILETIYST
jgi:hypothetical protein